jgi:succinyl-diaminopimelate desuccinylase
VVVAALVDEEGLMLGAKHFARTPLAAEVDGVIVCEPEGGEVCAVAKGAIRLRLDLVGKMAHGAMPQHGRNPIAAVPEILNAIKEIELQVQEDLGEHEHLGECYLTPTVLSAGHLEQINVISARCSIALDIRTVPGVDHGDLVDRVVSSSERYARFNDVRLTAEVIDDRPAVDTPIDHAVVRALVAAHERVHGEPPPYGGVPGATDGTILSRDAGLATVVYGPGGKWIAHQADEYVEIADVLGCARVYAEAARLFLSQSI